MALTNARLLIELSSLSISAEVLLFRLSGYNLDSPNDSYYFTNVNGVSFDGISYNPVACQLDGFEYKNEGTNEPTITVADPMNAIGAIETLQGATVQITATQRKFLDDSPDSDPTVTKYSETFLVQQKSEWIPGEYIVFVISSEFDYRDETIGRDCGRKCSYVYTDPNTCGYIPGAMFTFDNKRTLDPALDRCNKGVTACKLRGNINKFSGFPYVGLY